MPFATNPKLLSCTLDYVPIGIPDPKQIVNARWATVHPMMVVVNEIASLQLKGLWLYGVNEKVDIKFAVWAHNCIEMGAGSKIATLDKYKYALPLSIGIFSGRLCLVIFLAQRQYNTWMTGFMPRG